MRRLAISTAFMLTIPVAISAQTRLREIETLYSAGRAGAIFFQARVNGDSRSLLLAARRGVEGSGVTLTLHQAELLATATDSVLRIVPPTSDQTEYVIYERADSAGAMLRVVRYAAKREQLLVAVRRPDAPGQVNIDPVSVVLSDPREFLTTLRKAISTVRAM